MVTQTQYYYYYCLSKTIDADGMAVYIKGALSGLRQFLAPEISLKLMKNAFHFTLKALFILNIF